MKVSLVEVAPEIFEYDARLFVLTCHWTVGVGVPLAAAVKLTEAPALTAWLLGLVVTTGAVSTVKLAAVVVAVPTLLAKTAR